MKKTGLWAATLLVSCALLAACSPALNWRTIQLKDAPLQALLPCDAQTASRPVELGLGQVPLSVVGCEAQGATYAVSHFAVAEPARAAEALTFWQQAVLAQLKSADGVATRLNAKGDGPWVPKGALNLPQSLRITFEGLGPRGQKVLGHGLWFARLEGSGARLYHAVIYADKAMPAEAELFFSGLQLQ
ncbi:hypothetical protein [Comamonas testosteroni]|uniref:hypothetical protein n=1 Tax=Comamonas testosteroni TaxID=285 RepID=UPI0005B3D5F5|nr:hypothetical protein [Comamonas testosteroni]